MKKYTVIKEIYAKNIQEALKNEPKAEIVLIETKDAIEKQNNKLGF